MNNWRFSEDNFFLSSCQEKTNWDKESFGSLLKENVTTNGCSSFLRAIYGKRKSKIMHTGKRTTYFFLSLDFHTAFTLIFLTALDFCSHLKHPLDLLWLKRKIGDCSISQSILCQKLKTSSWNPVPMLHFTIKPNQNYLNWGQTKLI